MVPKIAHTPLTGLKHPRYPGGQTHTHHILLSTGKNLVQYPLNMDWRQFECNYLHENLSKTLTKQFPSLNSQIDHVIGVIGAFLVLPIFRIFYFEDFQDNDCRSAECVSGMSACWDGIDLNSRNRGNMNLHKVTFPLKMVQKRKILQCLWNQILSF